MTSRRAVSGEKVGRPPTKQTLRQTRSESAGRRYDTGWYVRRVRQIDKRAVKVLRYRRLLILRSSAFAIFRFLTRVVAEKKNPRFPILSSAR